MIRFPLESMAPQGARLMKYWHALVRSAPRTACILLFAGLMASPFVQAETEAERSASAPMSGERLAELIGHLDPAAVTESNSVQFSIGERTHFAVWDSAANRMRLMSPVAEVGMLSEALMFRMLQANYDSALDARYATAQGVVWSVFIHPLSSLDEEFLISAIRQVHIAAETFGSTFSSGELIYGGGDSQEQLEELEEALDRLLNPTT